MGQDLETGPFKTRYGQFGEQAILKNSSGKNNLCEACLPTNLKTDLLDHHGERNMEASAKFSNRSTL